MATDVQIWVFGADSDSEYVDYEDELINPGQEFNLRTKDAIRVKAQRRHVKLGIPRRPGYYQLQTRNSGRARPLGHYYEGHHWEIGPVSSLGGRGMDSEDVVRANPLLLEHTTRRLTITAVHSAMDLEQMRRAKQEEREREMAVRLYSPMNRELVRLIAYNLDEEKKAKKTYHILVEAEKEDVLQQLLHGTHQKTVDELMEEERERRVQLMNDLTDADKCTDDLDLLEVLKGLSKTAKVMKAFHWELMGAITDLNEVTHEENHAVDDLYLELKDDFVSSFKRATLLMKFHMAEENEKRRRMAEARAIYTGKKQLHIMKTEAMKERGFLQEELIRMFTGVIQEVAQRDAVTEDGSHFHKYETQEQLIHRLSIRQADKASARERVERIREMEYEFDGHMDPYKERIKDVILNVQEQMLVNKFHGKKLMFRQSPHQQRQEFYEAETPQDRHLREARMKSRRHNNVVITEYYL